MKWTKELPTRPGYYWWRAFLGSNVRVREVSDDPGEGRRGLLCGTWILLSKIGGEWYGPLLPPGDEATEEAEGGASALTTEEIRVMTEEIFTALASCSSTRVADALNAYTRAMTTGAWVTAAEVEQALSACSEPPYSIEPVVGFKAARPAGITAEELGEPAQPAEGVTPRKRSPLVESLSCDDKNRYSDLQVCQSNAGYYIGTMYTSPAGYTEPGSRDSDYYATREEAETALRTGSWEQRSHP